MTKKIRPAKETDVTAYLRRLFLKTEQELIDAETAMQELKQLSDETGLYSKISDEAIEAGRGVFYSDSRLRDPMSGLEFPGNPEEGGGGLEDDEEDPAGEGN